MMPHFKAFALYQCEPHFSISGVAATKSLQIRRETYAPVSPIDDMISERLHGSSGIMHVLESLRVQFPFSTGWQSWARRECHTEVPIQRAFPQTEADVYGLPSLPLSSNSPFPTLSTALP